jgi:hypothetical protein
MDQRVFSHSRYNYYKYYQNNKEKYKLNYETRKQKEILDKKNKEYYKDYWLNNRWKDKEDKGI